MSQLVGKKIGLALCGGIAAYKAADLASQLRKKGCHVFPLMTPSAREFIQPLTLEALTGHTVLTSGFDSRTPGGMDHINLVRELDLLVIAPLTANTAAKLANGIADHFLGAAYLAYRGPILACPAMNTAMLEHPATVRNLNQLQTDGVRLCYGDKGVLACGEVGPGRMAEPTVILDFIEEILSPKLPSIEGKNVLINAGPTVEDIDPVRFLSNRSTGKMGVAIAKAFRNCGANVTLVHGPINLDIPERIRAIPVRSAEEMAKSCIDRFVHADMAILSAAVADFKPDYSPNKIKKNTFKGSLELSRTTDILKILGEKKQAHQLLVGFAAETDQVDVFAKEKLQKKNADLILCNRVGKPGSGFGSDTNQLTAFSKDGESRAIGPGMKSDLAYDIIDTINDWFLSDN